MRAEPAADDPQELRSKLQALHWIAGPTTVPVGNNAHLRVPDDYVFLDVANTAKFEEILHNLGAGKEVMVAPKSLQWTAYLDFTAAGYVKDDEKIDAPGLLQTLKRNNGRFESRAGAARLGSGAHRRLGDAPRLQPGNEAARVGNSSRIGE